MRVAVVVLGEIGRSPRMQYHALSLAEHGIDVDFVGYGGPRAHEDVEHHARITQHLLNPFSWMQRPQSKNIFYYILFAIMKAVYMFFQWIFVLTFKISRPSAIMVQNPPAIPTLIAARIACWLRGGYLIIDWHNFGYTILQLTLGSKHIFVKLARFYERVWGCSADFNFCVTDAMKDFLEKEWGIKAVTVHDRPARFFKPVNIQAKHFLFIRLSKQLGYSIPAGEPESTLITMREGSSPRPLEKPGRPALIVTSTSWTPDEDLDMILQCVDILEEKGGRHQDSSVSNKELKYCFIITGKGAMKESFERKVESMNLSQCMVKTLWLEAEDYPKLLGSADLGVSLHASSSGLDLPMKVLDMFGCHLPVLALDFPTLPELVRHGVNGLVFRDASELADQVETLVGSLPSPKLAKLKKNVIQDVEMYGWADEWEKKCWPVYDTFSILYNY